MAGSYEVWPNPPYGSNVFVNHVPTGCFNIGGDYGYCYPALLNCYGPIFNWKPGYPEALESPCGYVLAWDRVDTSCTFSGLVPVNGVLVQITVVLMRSKGRMRLFLPNCEDLTLAEVNIEDVADWNTPVDENGDPLLDDNGDPLGFYFGCTGLGRGFSYDTGEPQCPQLDNGCPCSPDEPQFSENPISFECGPPA